MASAVQPARKQILHPLTAGLVLGVDWLFFGADALTLGADLFITVPAAFIITAVGVYWIQRTRGGDSRARALLKAIFSGAVAGAPTSIGGTILGTLILAMAGLRRRA
jgi:hypothetical protein